MSWHFVSFNTEIDLELGLVCPMKSHSALQQSLHRCLTEARHSILLQRLIMVLNRTHTQTLKGHQGQGQEG